MGRRCRNIRGERIYGEKETVMENLQDRFCWYEPEEDGSDVSPKERYQRMVDWAGQARGTNPDAFDAVTA